MTNMNMEPGRNPPRYQRQPVNYSGWIIGVIVALVVIAAIAYGMSDRSRIATGVPDTTAGQSNPPPGAPQQGPPATNR